MKIVCVHIPRLPVQIERRRLGLDSQVPLIVSGRPWNPDVVLDCCMLAEETGVEAGMPLARAAMRCPDATIVPADHDAYQSSHELLLSAQRQFTDEIETAGLGLTYASAEGLRRLFAENNALAAVWLKAVRDVTGLDATLGFAHHRYTAEQAALAASVNRTVVIAKAKEKAFLSALPITALPAMDEDLRRLRLLGVNSLGKLAAMPRNALVRQFTAEMGTFHDMACGNDPRGVFPDAPPLELSLAHTFEPPVVNQPRLLNHAKRIADALGSKLTQHQYQAQGMRVQVTGEQGAVRTAASSLEPPTAEGNSLFKRLTYLLEQAQPDQPISDLGVTLYPLRPRYLAATQLALFSAPVDYRLERLIEAIRRLRARFGEFVIVIASLLGKPSPLTIHVTTDDDGSPRSLVLRENIHLVFHIYEHWREKRLWWADPLIQHYYRVEDDAGTVRIIYRDLRTDQWWLQRQV